MKKRSLLLILSAIILSSCSNLSGRYSNYTLGYLGMDNSISTYDFGAFGKVTYSLSTSGKMSQNSFNKGSGKYSVKGNNVIVNFGGSDRIFTLSDDKKTITDNQGTNYKKQ
jgi:hypothetical protein